MVSLLSAVVSSSRVPRCFSSFSPVFGHPRIKQQGLKRKLKINMREKPLHCKIAIALRETLNNLPANTMTKYEVALAYQYRIWFDVLMDIMRAVDSFHAINHVHCYLHAGF